MHEIEVVAEDGVIVIYQSRTFGMTGVDEAIEIHPDQVDMLIKWVKEAKDKIENNG